MLSGDAVQSLGDFDDQMQRLKATTEVAGRELAISFLPATQKIAEALTDLASTVTTALSDGFQDSDVDTVLDALFDKLGKGLQNVEAIMPAVTKFVSGLLNKMVEFITQNLPMLVQTALHIVTGLADGLIQNLPVLIPAIVQCIMTIAQSLADPANVNLIMQSAIGLIKALGQGLINALPVLISMMPQLMVNIATSLVTQASQMKSVATAMVNQLVSGIMSGNIVGKIKQFFTEKVVKPFQAGVTNMTGIGKSMVEGLWKGINDKFTWIKNQISKWVGSVVDWFKKKLGIHSPSTVFAGIGENIAQGLGVGIKDGTAYVQNALGGTMNYALDASPYGMGGVNLYIDGIKYNTDDYVDSSITNFVENMIRRGQMYGRS